MARIRPLLAQEVLCSASVVAQPQSEKIVVLDEPRDESDVLRRNRLRQRHYALDSVYGQAATSAEVYAGTAKPLLKALLGGFNATVFAYGPVS